MIGSRNGPLVLPDTSAWVHYLRRGKDGRAAELGDLLVDRRVVTCGPVVAELLAGMRTADRESMAGLLGGLSWIDLDRQAWRRVGHVAAELRAAGQTVALTDITIAVAAERASAVLWTADADFERIANVVTSLEIRWLS